MDASNSPKQLGLRSRTPRPHACHQPPPATSFLSQQGSGLHQAAHQRLKELGLRIPEGLLLLLDSTTGTTR